jgi:co-chaperonin GroES (HSP10)
MNITPLSSNVILKMMPVDEKIGRFIVTGSVVEESTLAEVLVPNSFSYHPNGMPCEVTLKKGMKVRIPKGKIGTACPEAPDGEKWVCVPEDVIYYIVGE